MKHNTEFEFTGEHFKDSGLNEDANTSGALQPIYELICEKRYECMRFSLDAERCAIAVKLESMADEVCKDDFWA
jgi:hypothetical protein